MKAGAWEIYRYPCSLDGYYAAKIANNFSDLLRRIEALQPQT
jgi:hypothetical protein